MTAIGIDTHKATLAACALDELGQPLDERTFPNDPAGHLALLSWADEHLPDARIGLEGSAGFGAAAARFLVAAGREVREVPPHLSHRERQRTRRPGKTDPGDALAIARVTAREATLPPVRLADATREIGLLVEDRDDLVAEATRVRNRLHADLVVLVPGDGATAATLGAQGVQANTTADNPAALGVLRRLGFDLVRSTDDAGVEALLMSGAAAPG